MSDIPPETTPGMATPQRRFILIGGAASLLAKLGGLLGWRATA